MMSGYQRTTLEEIFFLATERELISPYRKYRPIEARHAYRCGKHDITIAQVLVALCLGIPSALIISIFCAFLSERFLTSQVAGVFLLLLLFTFFGLAVVILNLYFERWESPLTIRCPHRGCQSTFTTRSDWTCTRCSTRNEFKERGSHALLRNCSTCNSPLLAVCCPTCGKAMPLSGEAERWAPDDLTRRAGKTAYGVADDEEEEFVLPKKLKKKEELDAWRDAQLAKCGDDEEGREYVIRIYEDELLRLMNQE